MEDTHLEHVEAGVDHMGGGRAPLISSVCSADDVSKECVPARSHLWLPRAVVEGLV